MSNAPIFERLVEIAELRKSPRWVVLTADEQKAIEMERDHLKLAAKGEPIDPELLDSLERKRHDAVAKLDDMHHS